MFSAQSIFSLIAFSCLASEMLVFPACSISLTVSFFVCHKGEAAVFCLGVEVCCGCFFESLLSIAFVGLLPVDVWCLRITPIV